MSGLFLNKETTPGGQH
ncbi:hypothetical protein OGZ39_03930 [Lactococcus lactis]|nr:MULTISPECIES: hypothetical protein [Lactococcus]MDG4980805.1 hypothetical protein [Lactococcus lactis]MDH8063872.1 hypothetical protein [Lactococcus lactis subsp. lactis]WOF41583.1 hypothetical protein N4R43_08680 [Lactococcus lactis]